MSDRLSIELRTEEQLRHNVHVKLYPDGSQRLLVADKAIFRERGWEDAAEKPKQRTAAPDTPDLGLDVSELSQYQLERLEEAEKRRAAASAERARRRARAAISDLARSNPFRWFVTLTLDRERIDRYDMREITRHLNHWLDNAVRRWGLAYVLVPERHQDGAVHFHGLFNDAVSVRFSGRYDAEHHRIFNLPGWGWGFTTAIELYGDRRKAIAYVCKYIGKQTEKIGGRWYYSGGALAKPSVQTLDADYDALGGDADFTIEQLSANVKVVEVDAPVPPRPVERVAVAGPWRGGNATAEAGGRRPDPPIKW